MASQDRRSLFPVHLPSRSTPPPITRARKISGPFFLVEFLAWPGFPKVRAVPRGVSRLVWPGAILCFNLFIEFNDFKILNMSIKTFSTNSVSILLFTCSLLAGCSVTPTVGDAQSDTPPQLVAGSQRDASGRVIYQWDRPQAFGRVQGERKVLGDAACLLGRVDLEAVGFHSQAKDADGAPIPGGGYFCAVKSRGDRPAEQAPQLVRTRGVLGWNQPGLFGAVPEAQKARGDAVCNKAQPGFEAAAYHPAALNEAGQAIAGGGFFCAPKRQTPKALG